MIKLLDEKLMEEIEVGETFLRGITPIGISGRIIYKYCKHFKKNCFETVKYKCNGYREYIKDETK